MRLVWTTDIHLDHCVDNAIQLFFNNVLYLQPDQILLTGDISNALDIDLHLREIAKAFSGIMVNFVTGNHDYYGTSQYCPSNMSNVRKKIANICKIFDNLNWLDHSGPVKLTNKAALIGSSLWCDWRAGLGDKSSVWLNDYLLISDLFGYCNSCSDRAKIKKKVQKLARGYTKQLMIDFNKAIDQGFKEIIIGVHVPPFHEASFYKGKVQNDDFAAHFVCKVAGDELKGEAKKYPNVNITVLSGHTHGSGSVQILPNLNVINGGAQYKHPTSQIPIICE